MFEIYGRNNCAWCERAKDLLEERGIPYSYRNIEENPSYLEDFKEDFKGKKTVPQIRRYSPVGYTYIGGYEDLVGYLRENN